MTTLFDWWRDRRAKANVKRHMEESIHKSPQNATMMEEEEKQNKISKKKKYQQRYELVMKIKSFTDQTFLMTNKVSDIILMLGSLRNKPGIAAWMAAGTKVTQLLYEQLLKQRFREIAPYVDQLEVYTQKLGGKWIALETNKQRIIQILHDHEIGDVIEEEEEEIDAIKGNKKYQETMSVVHAVVEDCDLIWKQYKSFEPQKAQTQAPFCSKLMIRADQHKRALKAIGNLVWGSYGTNHLTTSHFIRREYERQANIEFTEDLFGADILQSEIADKIAENTKKFLSVKEIETRAILLYGPPGTGKSTAARYISHILDFRSLRVNFSMLQETPTLVQCLDILRPDMIIIDDIDRSPGDGYLLEALELLRKRTRVIIASANYPKKLDYAVLRPGRFDEAIKITTLDEKVIRRTIGEGLTEEQYETLGKLPIAYINEFALRRKVLGEEEAAKSVKELYDRVEMGKNDDDDDEVNKENYAEIKLATEMLQQMREKLNEKEEKLNEKEKVEKEKVEEKEPKEEQAAQPMKVVNESTG